MELTLVKSNIINPLFQNKTELVPDAYLLFSEKTGKILDFGIYKERTISDNMKVIDRTDCFLMPSMIDLHSHVPQWTIKGIGKDDLLYWLNNSVKDAEIKFCNTHNAKKISSDFLNAVISSGTATLCAYSNGSIESTDILFETAKEKGLRLVCGNIIGDLGGFYCRQFDKKQIIQGIKFLIEKWHAYADRLFYALTPRFALYCSTDFMKVISNIFHEYNDLYLQTHLSESKKEIKEVLALHKNFKSYTEIYEKCCLLSTRTLLAHCIYLNQSELDLLMLNNCSIIHCPASNRYLGSGIMPLKKYLSLGLKTALGTDIGGGYYTSIINEAREAIEQSKTLSMLNDRYLKDSISVSEAFYIATLGGAKALNIDSNTGNFKKNKYADFITVRIFDNLNNKSPDQTVSNIIYNQHTICDVYCMGKKIYGK